MAKSTAGKVKRAGIVGKTKLTKKRKAVTRTNKKIAEHINCLLELHKLQGIILADIKKEI